MMDSVDIRDRDTRKGAVSPVQNETICGWPHPTIPSTPPPGPLKLLAGPKMRTADFVCCVAADTGGVNLGSLVVKKTIEPILCRTAMSQAVTAGAPLARTYRAARRAQPGPV